MFRSDRDALADKVSDLQVENERLRAQNEAMRDEILGRVGDTQRRLQTIYASRGAALSEGERIALSRHRLQRFPAWAMGLLSVLTLGIFPLVHFGLMQARLPRVAPDDPSAARSIGFWFIPCVNVFWMFFAPLRLVDRLNLQFALRGQKDGVHRAWIITAGVLSVIPWVNQIAAPIAWVVAAIRTQMAVNRLVALDAARPAEAQAARLRIPDVADLPGPDEVAREQQAEEEAAAAERAVQRSAAR